MSPRKLRKKKVSPTRTRSANRKRGKPSTQRLSPGEWFEKLVALQKRLRAPNGCPWDREQTHSTLRTYLLEEAYEVLDAFDSGDDAKFAEEMGDLLLQIIFHSEIATEQKRFTVSDVIREVHEKMVRRHPHVFGDKRAKDAAAVLKNWERIKAEERQAKKPGGAKVGGTTEIPSLLDGVTRNLPATLEGFQLTRKAARIGFDWENPDDILEKIREEIAELQQALKSNDAVHAEEEIGDLFFAAVNLSRFLNIDPEIALKKANAKFSRRFRKMEAIAGASGRALANVPRPEMEALWDSAKHADSASPTAAARATK
ncbi:MAG TPA: nucleoside triphosphate pyrophosphohydrolase [Candidatus Acidoferrum sp.]|jgi:MazG family protein